MGGRRGDAEREGREGGRERTFDQSANKKRGLTLATLDGP